MGGYSLVNRLGLMDLPPVKWAFRVAYFEYKRRLEDPFWSLAEQHPEWFRQGHVLDVGANIGYTAVVFARALQGSGKVYAFEPDDTNVAELKSAVAAYRVADRVEVVSAAVGESSGVIRFWKNEEHRADHRVFTDALASEGVDPSTVVEVPLLSLDAFARERAIERDIAFIKLDVQGYEIAVCRGMSEILEHNPSAPVAVEYMPEAFEELGYRAEELLEFFDSRGYVADIVHRDGRLTPGSRPAIEAALTERGYVDLIYRR